MKSFYIWILPESKKILVSDRNDIPTQCCNLSEFHKRFTIDGNITFDGFDTWDKAVNFATAIQSKLLNKTNYFFELDFDNEAGRFTQHEFDIINGTNTWDEIDED